MEGRISALTLTLCLVWSSVGAITVTIPQASYEFKRGDNITLPCTFKTVTGKIITIKWSLRPVQAEDTETEIAIYYSADESVETGQDYAGRASMDVDIPTGRANLKLNSISLADNRVFDCHVQAKGDMTGKPDATTRLVVLVPPSPPMCKIQGTAEYGENINLTCVSQEGSPPPTYKWDSRDVQNNPRVPDPKTTDKDGILSLYNISKDASGFYICTSSNKMGRANCNITLSVMPPSMKVGATVAIIAGVAAALLALALIIYCCCCRKKKNKEEEYAMGAREDEFHDQELAKNSESRQADGQENIHSSENSTVKSAADRHDEHEEQSERGYDRRRDDDDRLRVYDDRRSDYDDRRSDYSDRRSPSGNRRSDYDDRRSDYSDRRDKYSDRHERYDDDRRYDDRDRDRPPVPTSKPPRRNYDD
uniref:glycoprotein A33 (transmembrane), paralog a n=1 Tax=Monopterus albus TaxID=43700 RepID=UPI0009B4E39E|nr:cell surface A33 antigen-like [Monopterus albus]